MTFKNLKRLVWFIIGLIIILLFISQFDDEAHSYVRFIRGTVLDLKESTLPSRCDDGQIRLDSSTNKVKKCLSNAWSALAGSGVGSVTFFSDFDADTISNVNTYDDSGADPTDGTGGSPAEISTSSETSSPLAGAASYKLSKTTANSAQGEGFSLDTDTTPDPAEAGGGNATFISFEYQTSANYSQDIDVWIYRIGSNTLEALNTFQGSSFDNNLPNCPSTSVCSYTGWTTLSATDTDVRLIFHITSTSTSTFDVYVDRIAIGPASKIQSAIVGDWTSFTMNIDAVTTAPTKGTTTRDEAIYRRVGDTIEIIYNLKQTAAGTAGSGIYLFDLPDNLTIDTSKLSIDTNQVSSTVGYGTTNSTADGTDSAYVVAYDTNSLAVMDVDSATAVSSTYVSLGNTSATISFYAKVPVTGWNSGQELSTTQIDLKTVKARYTTTAGQSISNSSTDILDYDTKDYDTHSAVTTGASWKFTAPHDGKYKVTASMLWASAAFTSNAASTIYIYKNGSLQTSHQTRQWAGLTTSYQQMISDTVDLAKDDYIDIRVDHGEGTARSVNTASNYTYVEIEELPDLSLIGVRGVYELKETEDTTQTNFPIAAGTWGDVDSLDLTPGTWNVSVFMVLLNNGAVTAGNQYIGIGTTSGNNGPNADDNTVVYNPGTSGARYGLYLEVKGVTVTSTTTYYFKGRSDNSITNLQYRAYKMQADRVK